MAKDKVKKHTTHDSSSDQSTSGSNSPNTNSGAPSRPSFLRRMSSAFNIGSSAPVSPTTVNVDPTIADVNPEEDVNPTTADINPEVNVNPTTADINPEVNVNPTTADINPEVNVNPTTAGINPEVDVNPTTAGVNPEEDVNPTTAGVNPEEDVNPTTAGINPEVDVNPTTAGVNPEEDVNPTTEETKPAAPSVDSLKASVAALKATDAFNRAELQVALVAIEKFLTEFKDTEVSKAQEAEMINLCQALTTAAAAEFNLMDSAMNNVVIPTSNFMIGMLNAISWALNCIIEGLNAAIQYIAESLQATDTNAYAIPTIGTIEAMEPIKAEPTAAEVELNKEAGLKASLLSFFKTVEPVKPAEAEIVTGLTIDTSKSL